MSELHPGTVIALAIKAKLANPPGEDEPYPTDVEGKVGYCGALPMEPDELPALLVIDGDERSEGESMHLPQRVLPISVVCIGHGRNEAELMQSLASLAWQVEKLVMADPKLKDDSGWAWASDIEYQGLDKEYPDRSGRDFVCIMTVKFDVHYQVHYGVDESDLADFLHFHGEYVLQPYLHPGADEFDAKDDVMLEPPE